MKKIVFARKTHKWLALLAGIQVLIWAISGFYMTAVDIDTIHGDHLVKHLRVDPSVFDNIVPISSEIIEQLKPIRKIDLKIEFGQPIYDIRGNKKRIYVDALTGKRQKSVSKQLIVKNAAEIYAGDAKVSSIDLLPRYPSEIGGRKHSVWQVNYDDWLQSTLYFHSKTGRLISKRTDLWRVYDFLWVLHIMDYAQSRGPRGYLFRIFSLTSLLMVTFGSWLLIYRLKGDKS